MNFFSPKKEESVDTIMEAFTSTIERLNNLSVAESEQSAELRRQAEELQSQADARSAEAARARALSDKLADLVSA